MSEQSEVEQGSGVTPPTYALKGCRPGFEILVTDDVKDCDDGYTEVRRNGQVVGVYRTALLRPYATHPNQGEQSR